METTASTSVSGTATMMTASLSSRRRHRPSPPAANASDRRNDHGDQKNSTTPHHHHQHATVTVEVAKARFVQTIRDSMHTLMTDYGFSRERATAALLRELSAVAGPPDHHSPQFHQVEQPFTESNNASSPPPLPLVKDEQVFDAMQQYGLSAEQAMRALTVSTTLERFMSSNPRCSLAEALQDMTHQLSRANWGDRLSSEHESGSHEERANQHSLPRVLPPKSLLPDKKRSLPPPQRLTVVKPSQSSSSSAKKARPSSSSSSKSSSKKVKETGASNDPAGPLPSRARSDSVTERVSAKLAVAAADGTGGSSSNSSSSSDPSHRVIKRAREQQQQSEDAPSVGSNKRSRTNTA